MPRALRIQYPGAIYHVMKRGDRRELIFRGDLDHKRFLVCTRSREGGLAGVVFRTSILVETIPSVTPG